MREIINPLIILLHTRGLGRKKVHELICHFGSAEKVLEAGWEEKKRVLFGKWPVSEWERELDKIEEERVELISFQNPLYPKNLLKLPDFPLLLYVKGKLPSKRDTLAIIGTRNATLYGKEGATLIAKELSRAGICVISGLARGIDTAAHCGALEGEGSTVAIIGSGLCDIYPKENLALAHKIVERGALISEFPMEMAPHKGSFPQRNRLISGMADGVALIESPLKGGGMLTMESGYQLNKPLFALPGRIDWPTFAGNHWLIKHKRASLIESGKDLLLHFGKEIECNPPQSKYSLSEEEKSFLNRLPHEEKSIEELVLLTQLPIMQLNIFLTRLVLKKALQEFPGKIYKKI